MRKFWTGQIVFDELDILCLSFSTGCSIAYLIQKYRKYKKIKNEDPIVTELKQISPVKVLSVDGEPLTVPLVRGGDLKNNQNKLAIITLTIYNLLMKKKNSKIVQILLPFLSQILSKFFDIYAGSESLTYVQVTLISVPAAMGGVLTGVIVPNPLFFVLLPLGIFFGREIKYISDPSEKCRVLCKTAEQFHNKQLAVEMQNEMKKLKSLTEDMSTSLQLPLDKVNQLPLLCVEEKLSLLQRYKLREVVKNEKARNRIQHFSEFIKKFPECDADIETVYEHIAEKIAE